MEMRGVDHEIGTPYPSTKLPNSDHHPHLTPADTRRDHTVPQLNFTSPHNHNHPKLSLHQYLHKHTKDHPQSTTPDPVHTINSTAASPSAVTPLATATTNNNVVPSPVQYRECLKNHAASTGGHVLDGCGEFMPDGEDGTLKAFRCAACECHRNFHRKEVKDQEPLQQALPPNGFFSSHRSDKRAVPLSSHPHQLAAAVPISSRMMAFGGSNGDPDDSSSEDLNMYYHQSGNGGRELFGQQPQLMKKRFRTKFTQEQKEKMVEFAEKLGWRIQKHHELEVQQFCAEVGVKRQVFKVWMHNNKQAIKNKPM